MALKSTFLVLSMAVVAVTSKWPIGKGWGILPNAGVAEKCDKEIIKSIYQACLYSDGTTDEFPFMPDTPNAVWDLAGGACGFFFPKVAECVQRMADKRGCSNSSLLADQVLTTGGGCHDYEPIGWMEDLLNRMGDMPSDCVVDLWQNCDLQNLQGGARLDQLIRCLDKEMRATCPNVAHFTTALTFLIMFETDMGATPSAETVALMKKFPN